MENGNINSAQQLEPQNFILVDLAYASCQLWMPSWSILARYDQSTPRYNSGRQTQELRLKAAGKQETAVRLAEAS